jgi:hypothetical protein
MSRADDFNVRYDDVGMRHVAYGGSSWDEVVKVEPPKPPPQWVVRMRARVPAWLRWPELSGDEAE